MALMPFRLSIRTLGDTFNDGPRLISASDDASIKVWNIKTRICDMSLPAHNYGILGMHYDKDAQKLITGSYDGCVKTWNVNFERRSKVDKMTVREMKDILKQKKVDFSDCIEKQDIVSRLLHSRALPPIENHLTLSAHTSTVVGIHSMHGMVASCGRDSYIRLWELETGEEMCRIPVRYFFTFFPFKMESD
jgi:WD40 repeat protein